MLPSAKLAVISQIKRGGSLTGVEKLRGRGGNHPSTCKVRGQGPSIFNNV